MTRLQVAVLAAFLGMMTLLVGQMSTATPVMTSPPVAQTIAKPFCGSTEDGIELGSVTLAKAGSSVAASWTFLDPMPSAFVVKADLASPDFRYHWLLAVEIRNGEASRIQTLDTVSKQLLGFTVDGGSATAKVMDDRVEVTVPLPGAPDRFGWFAAAGPAQVVDDLTGAHYGTFCPAGWLAQYPPES